MNALLKNFLSARWSKPQSYRLAVHTHQFWLMAATDDGGRLVFELFSGDWSKCHAKLEVKL